MRQNAATAPNGAVTRGNAKRRISASPANQVAGTWSVTSAYSSASERQHGPWRTISNFAKI
jgi:hypothetical protein